MFKDIHRPHHVRLCATSYMVERFCGQIGRVSKQFSVRDNNKLDMFMIRLNQTGKGDHCELTENLKKLKQRNFTFFEAADSDDIGHNILFYYTLREKFTLATHFPHKIKRIYILVLIRSTSILYHVYYECLYYECVCIIHQFTDKNIFDVNSLNSADLINQLSSPLKCEPCIYSTLHVKISVKF